MKRAEDIEAKTEELIMPILEKCGVELYLVEYVKEGSDYYLRIYIEKPGGVTVNDCEAVSREFNVILDEEDYVDGEYIFEVSSPGLTRPLKREKDYIKALGKNVDIKLYKALDGVKEISGKLVSYEDSTVRLILDDNTEWQASKDMIAAARISFEQDEDDSSN